MWQLNKGRPVERGTVEDLLSFVEEIESKKIRFTFLSCILL